MALRAGLLNRKIEIYRATITKNAFGEEVEIWTLKYTTRARVTQTNSAKQTENSEIVMSYSKEFWMRYYVPVSEFDIIKFDGKQYRVMSIERDRENVYTKVIGELING